MKFYSDFYTNYTPGDSGYESLPQLIIDCEDEKHIVETYKNIVLKGLEIPKIKLYFTTDLRQNQESLSNSLIEFKLDEETNKYKMENVELKLLDNK